MVEWTRRLAYIEEHFGDALYDKALDRETEDYRAQRPRLLVERMAEADPSRNKSATQWLVQAYLRDGFLLEDLGRAREALDLFGRCRRSLPVEARDLGRYSTLPDLEEVVAPFVVNADEDETASGKERRRREKKRAHAESVILHEGEDGLIVAVPLTEFASKWWGKGTKWCTAADTDNMFESYHHKAPLIVIVMPGGMKLQMWAPPDNGDRGTFQFMYASDRSVHADYMVENWDTLHPLLHQLSTQNGGALSTLLACMCLSLEDAVLVMRKWPDLFPTVLRSLAFTPTEADIHALVTAIPPASKEYKFAVNLEDIPREFRSERVVFETIARAGLCLSQVSNPTRELCLAAVTHAGEAIRYVPKSMLDREIVLVAVRNSYRGFIDLPQKWKDDPEVMAVAAANHGFLIEYMKHPLPRELYLAALKSDPRKAWEFIPHAERDRELSLEAVKLDGYLIARIPAQHVDVEIQRAAAMQTGFALDHLPEQFRDKEVCLAAVRSTGSFAFHLVPEDVMDEDIKVAFIENFGTCGEIPEDEMTTAMHIAEIRKNPEIVWTDMLDVYKDEPALRELAVSIIVDEFRLHGRRPLERFYESCPELLDLIPPDASIPARWDVSDLAGLRQALDEAFMDGKTALKL